MFTEPLSFTPRHTPRDPAAEFFLARLRRLILLQATPAMRLTQRRLLRKAIFSTYLDCRAMGLAAEARAILAGSTPPQSDGPSHLHAPRQKHDTEAA